MTAALIILSVLFVVALGVAIAFYLKAKREAEQPQKNIGDLIAKLAPLIALL